MRVKLVAFGNQSLLFFHFLLGWRVLRSLTWLATDLQRGNLQHFLKSMMITRIQFLVFVFPCLFAEET